MFRCKLCQNPHVPADDIHDERQGVGICGQCRRSLRDEAAPTPSPLVMRQLAEATEKF